MARFDDVLSSVIPCSLKKLVNIPKSSCLGSMFSREILGYTKSIIKQNKYRDVFCASAKTVISANKIDSSFETRLLIGDIVDCVEAIVGDIMSCDRAGSNGDGQTDGNSTYPFFFHGIAEFFLFCLPLNLSFSFLENPLFSQRKKCFHVLLGLHMTK